MPAQRVVSKTIRKKLVAAYHGGGRVAEIGKPYGYDYKTTRRVLVDAGVAIRVAGGRKLPPPAPIQELLAWHKAGESCRQIALRLGTYPNKVADALRDAGHEVRDDRTRRGSANPLSLAKRKPSKEGYVSVILDPADYHLCGTRNGRSGRSMLEHRLIMARSLGRPLLRSETVHHKNGHKSDNRLRKGHEINCPRKCCNLELWSSEQPPGQRVSDKLRFARAILKFYGK